MNQRSHPQGNSNVRKDILTLADTENSDCTAPIVCSSNPLADPASVKAITLLNSALLKETSTEQQVPPSLWQPNTKL